MQKQGRLKNWNDDKGFGFIAGEKGQPDLFIHISDFQQCSFRPQINQQITFTPSQDKRGRSRAINAHIAGQNIKAKKNLLKGRSAGIFSIGFSVIFLILVVVLVIVEKLPWIVLYWYLMLSTLLFVLYKSDKQAAKLQYWRTKENTLHILSMIGGWPGALIAQQTLRHKSNKTSFRVIFFITLLVNLAGFGWFFTQQGDVILGFIDASVKVGLAGLIRFLNSF